MGAFGGSRAAVLVAALAMAWAPARGEDACAPFGARFDTALAASDFAAALSVEREVAESSACGNKRDAFRARRAARQIDVAESLRNDPARAAEREALVLQADEPGLLWTAAYAAGVLHLEKKRYAQAAEAFERAITLSSDSAHTRAPLKAEVRGELVNLAYEAKARANRFVSAGRTTRGEVGGSLGGDRAVAVRKVPLPIQFETDRDDLTAVGRQYADELATAVKEQRPEVVVLEGHTDERGTASHNLDLSKRRVERVAAHLREKGVAARIETRAKGKSEPFTPPNAVDLTEEEIWTLNRRVVWQRQ